MDTFGTTLFLGITPASSINPSLAADALLQQATLDPDHIAILAEAYRTDSPTQASHVEFCRDEYLRPREENRNSARQHLAGIVRRTSLPMWGQIWTRALETHKARIATTLPPAPAATIETKILTLAEILKKEPQVRANFDPFSITLRDLKLLPSLLDQLNAQVLLYRTIETFALNAVQVMEGFRENDLSSLREMIRRVQLWQHKVLPLVQEPLKHIGDGAVGLMQLLLAPLISIFDGRTSWQEGLTSLQNNFGLLQILLDRTHGYYTCKTRATYAKAMTTWFIGNSESSRWNNGKWELTATPAGKGVGKGWPPDLNNLRLETYLKLLGWTMEIRPVNEGIIIITVDFGNWRF